MFNLVPDTFAPTINLITPGDGQEWAEGLGAVQVRFNEAIDAATVNAANFQLRDSGGAAVAPLAVALGNRDRTVLMTYPPQLPRSYSVVVDAAQVTDRAGNALGAAGIISQFTLVETDVVWVGSSGFWDDATHWSTGVVPGPADRVFIGSVVGDITVAHRSGTDSVTSINSHENFVMTGGSLALAEASKLKDLTLSSGTLSGSGDITVRDTMTWMGGAMSGIGSTNIPQDAALNMSGGDKSLIERTLNLAGTTTWTANGIRTGRGATINNLPGAVFDIQGDFFMDFAFPGTEPVFNNQGTVKKTGGAGFTMIAVLFNNTGLVQVQAGTLNLFGGGNSSGDFEAVAPGTLQFGGQFGGLPHTLDADSSVFGDGTIKVTSGTADFGGAYNVTGGATTTINGGIANFNANATTTNLTLSTGTLSGTGNITVTGLFMWTGGFMDGTGSTTVNGNGTIGGFTKNLIRRTLNLAGTTTWTGDNRIRSGLGATINNLPGAVFDMQISNGRGLFFDRGGVKTTFNNQGTVKRTVDTGEAFIDAVFNSSGTVEAGTGTLTLTGGGTHTGTFDVASGAGIQFAGGTHTLDAGTIITGAGETRITMGTVTIAAAATVTAANMRISGGTLSGAGDLNISGTLTWTGGTMNATGTTSILGGGAMNISGSGNKALTARTISNAGTVTWSGGQIDTGDAASFFNTGTWDVQTDAGLLHQPGGTKPVFDNGGGTFQKTAGAGNTNVTVFFDNTGGTITITSGTVTFNGGTTGAACYAFVWSPSAPERCLLCPNGHKDPLIDH